MLKDYNLDIFNVHKVLVERYLTYLPKGDVRNLAITFLEKGSTMPADKQGRWVGYLQRYVIQLGLTSVKSEREISRPLFHKVYAKYGLSTETIGVD